MNTYSFTSLPGFSRLFTDFIDNAPGILSRFPANTPDGVDPGAVAKRLQRTYDRPLLAEVIRETMRDVSLHPAQEKALQRLLHDGTSVVMTGQQAGLFGGPLYTLLKALSAVTLARDIAEKTGGDSIPVFWVEDNDHDFAEIAQAAVLNRDYQVQRTVVAETPGEERAPVGSRVWQGADAALDELLAALQPTDFTDELAALLRRACAPGTGITTSFVQILHDVLAPTGMVFVSAFALQQRGMFDAVLRREIDEPGASHAVLERASQELTEAGYHMQARPLPVNSMLLLDGRRCRIQPVDDGFRVEDRLMSAADVHELVASSPGVLSPTVLTRPLVQDALFPTAAYVAGPGEIAYAAQLKELYEMYDIPVPAFVARHSATLTERKFDTFFADQSLELPDMLQPYEQVEKYLLELTADESVESSFETASARLRDVFTELETSVTAVDPTLGPSTGRALAMAQQQIDQLAGKVQKARKRQQETALARLRQAHSFVFPEHTLQERSIHWLYYRNKFGGDELLATLGEIIRCPAGVHYVAVIGNRAGE